MRPDVRGSEADDKPGAKARAAKAAAAAVKAEEDARKKEAAAAREWMDGADVRAMKKTAAAAAAAAEKEAKRKLVEEQLRKEEEELASLRKLRGADKVAARKATAVASESSLRSRMDAPSLEARSIDAAIAVLDIATGAAPTSAGAGSEEEGHEADVARAAKLAASLARPGAPKEDDKHPEKRMKAAFKAYEERELPKLKAEYPTLRRSQLNEMLWRKWERSPENPVVAAKAAAAAAGR